MSESRSSGGSAKTPTLLRGRAGSYAVTTTSSMPWLTNTTATNNTSNSGSSGTKPKSRKVKMPTVMHPHFEFCAQLIPEDPFWEDIFRQASYNKMPKGFLYRDGYLTFKKGTRIQRLEIPRNPAEALSACLDFFKTMGGIRSSQDRDRERKETDERYNNASTLEESEWGEIKTKKVIESLINEFIYRNAELMNLSDKREKEFRSLVNMGFLLGQFNSNSVVFVNGRIQSLIGLNINLEAKTFSINNSELVRDKSSRTKLKIIPESEYLNPKYQPLYAQRKNPPLANLWSKYLDLFSKRTNVPYTPRIQVMNGSVPATPRSGSLPQATPGMVLHYLYSNNGRGNAIPIIDSNFLNDSTTTDDTDD